ncbi:MAG: class I SAM-dependent methyltransferase [Congregibacter sp.]
MPKHIYQLFALVVVLLLAACQQKDVDTDATAAEGLESVQSSGAVTPGQSAALAELDTLDAVLAAQPEEVRARYVYRHPRETLEFFAIEAGMTVVEALPGGGWYTRILAPYLGSGGTVVGVDYDPALFPLFGFYSAERLAAKATWAEDWVVEAQEWFDIPVADIDAFQFGSMPNRMEGEADAVLLIRALHNMARFESQGDFLSTALAEVYRVLKPGGVVGVVQHMAPEDMPDAWAGGSAGYLKKSFVVSRFESAGLEFVAESDLNTNPEDKPTVDDVVWRLPPTLATSGDDPELAAQLSSIGESNRMTLLFRKPE